MDRITMNETPRSHEDDIPEAKTPGEVNVHLGYIRRDIQTLQNQTKDAFKSLENTIGALDDHYITESEFRPVSDAVKANAVELKLMTEWRDTFNGKMMGFGTAISLVSALLSFVINQLFN